jgi:hypothetical protein
MKSHKYIPWMVLFAATLACSSSSLFGQDSELLFEDDFSDEYSGWPNFVDEDGFTGYHKGGYRMLVTTENKDVWVVPGLNFSDVSIEVDATKIGGDDDNDFGVICRAEDLDNFYAAVISSDGYYRIFHISDRDGFELIDMEEWQPDDAIRQGNATNHLRFDCIGNTLSLYVNGELVARVEDSNLTSGDIGLLAGTYDILGTDILFDDLFVYSP